METQNFIQVVEQTREEKIKMYLKCSKQKLAEMLVECNLIIDRIPVTVVSPSEDKTAEPTPIQILNNQSHGFNKGQTESAVKAMKEYATLCRNKAIEEAVAIAESNGNHSTAHDINKLKA